MSTITISDICISNLPAGLDLFSGSENYINELSDDDMTNVNGGISVVTTIVITASAVLTGAGISFSIGLTTRGKA
jgi:hypothetical protein